MKSITTGFVDYLYSKAGKITNKTMQKAEKCKQDYLAVAFAGALKNKGQWQSLLSIIPNGNAQIIGYTKRVDGKTAALINGFNAHSLELDDGQRFAMIHLGASIISAIKAAADERMIDDVAIHRGIVMGYEAACRIAIAMQPSHKNLGYHAAGTCGTIGSAVGVAFALGMNKEQMKRVLVCAAGSAAGMLEMQGQQSELKPYNVGRAAMDGLMAAYAGFTGFESPDDILGGERGFFYVFSDEWYQEKLIEKTDYFEIERTYFKPYASCRHSHSAVEAAIGLHEGLNVDQIQSIVVKTYKMGVKGHDNTDIRGIAAAKLSTPYAVAAGLLYGRADLTVFEPLKKEIVKLAQRIKICEDPDLTRESPQKRVAVVTVTLIDGTVLENRVEYAKGEPENPMTEEELQEKNRMLLSYAAKHR